MSFPKIFFRSSKIFSFIKTFFGSLFLVRYCSSSCKDDFSNEDKPPFDNILDFEISFSGASIFEVMKAILSSNKTSPYSSPYLNLILHLSSSFPLLSCIFSNKVFVKILASFLTFSISCFDNFLWSFLVFIIDLKEFSNFSGSFCFLISCLNFLINCSSVALVFRKSFVIFIVLL